MTFANRTEFSKRAARYSDYNRDWHLADESQPFGMMGGMSFPLFAPAFNGGGRSLTSAYSPTRTARRPYSSLDYDRFASPRDAMARLSSSNYYDPAKENPSPASSPSQTSPSRGYSNSGTDSRRYQKPKYGPSYTAQSAPGYSTKSRAKSPSGPSYAGSPSGMPPDPFFPEYDDSIPRYSYNPSETPKCAKDSNVSYCVEDSEYPM